jgi:hypothetical protein
MLAVSAVSVMNRCPFKPGDFVVYRPTWSGRARVELNELCDLVPGRTYVVADVVADSRVLISGFENRIRGGLDWTEFTEDYAARAHRAALVDLDDAGGLDSVPMIPSKL